MHLRIENEIPVLLFDEKYIKPLDTDIPVNLEEKIFVMKLLSDINGCHTHRYENNTLRKATVEEIQAELESKQSEEETYSLEERISAIEEAILEMIVGDTNG